MKKKMFKIFLILLVTTLLLTGCKTNKTNTSESNHTKSSQNTSNNTNNPNDLENNPKQQDMLELGKYIIQQNNSETDGEFHDGGDEYISFLEDNKFQSYIGWGMSIAGYYEIENNNMIKCKAEKFQSEYGPEQEINANILFNIEGDNLLKVIEASETFKIQVVEVGEDEWLLSDESKDIYLSIFTEGNTFGLSEEN